MTFSLHRMLSLTQQRKAFRAIAPIAYCIPLLRTYRQIIAGTTTSSEVSAPWTWPQYVAAYSADGALLLPIAGSTLE